MPRVQTLIAAAALAVVLPLGVALAQGQSPSTAPTGAVVNPATSLPTSPDDVSSPMQEQAMAPNTAPVSNVCGPHSVTLKDEFGRTYNCRGDRVR